MPRYTITSRIQARARYYAMTAAQVQWDSEALAIDYIVTGLISERFTDDQAQAAAKKAWENTKSQPPL
jgi:hypothetical protein